MYLTNGRSYITGHGEIIKVERASIDGVYPFKGSNNTRYTAEGLYIEKGKEKLYNVDPLCNIVAAVCECGNPELGFDCTCEHTARFPGEREFSCEHCGVYSSSRARCNKCEVDT